jgi:hypothetical protein
VRVVVVVVDDDDDDDVVVMVGALIYSVLCVQVLWFRREMRRMAL